jgi:hypothetical protein
MAEWRHRMAGDTGGTMKQGIRVRRRLPSYIVIETKQISVTESRDVNNDG